MDIDYCNMLTITLLVEDKSDKPEIRVELISFFAINILTTISSISDFVSQNVLCDQV
jgi:hypothetical protein